VIAGTIKSLHNNRTFFWSSELPIQDFPTVNSSDLISGAVMWFDLCQTQGLRQVQVARQVGQASCGIAFAKSFLCQYSLS
jgi:hypothetical protein